MLRPTGTEVRGKVGGGRFADFDGDDLLNGLGLNGISEGDVRVYALQLRYAINDRLAIIATQDQLDDLKANMEAAGMIPPQKTEKKGGRNVGATGG